MNHLPMALEPANTLLMAQIKIWQQSLSTTEMKDSAGPRRLIADLLAALAIELQQHSVIQLIDWIQRCGEARQQALSTSHLNPAQGQAALERVRQQRQLVRDRNKRPGQSKLDRYQQAIRQLIQQGASQRDIRWWLRCEKRCVISQATICRYLKAWQITP